MKRLITLVLLLSTVFALGADRIALTVTVTNTPADGDTFILLGTTRTFKTTVTTASTQIARTNTAARTAVQLFNHMVNYPYTGNPVISMPATNQVQIVGQPGQAIVATYSTNNWFSLSYSTQAVTTAYGLRVNTTGEAAKFLDGSYLMMNVPGYLSNMVFVAEGDSHTARANGWLTWFSEMYPWTSFYVITNTAVGGETLSDMISEYATQVQPWVQAFTNRCIVSIEGGANDLYYGSNAVQIIYNMSNYCALVHADGGKVMGWDLTCRGNPVMYPAVVTAVNAWFLTATNFDYKVFWGNYFTNTTDTALFNADTTHLTDDGYKMAAVAADSGLRKHSTYPWPSLPSSPPERVNLLSRSGWISLTNISLLLSNASYGTAKLKVFGPDSAASGGVSGYGNLKIGSANLELAIGQQAPSTRYVWLQSRFPSLDLYYDISLNPLGGNVGIRTTTPSYPLEVNGVSYFHGVTNTGSMYSSGADQIFGNTSQNYTLKAVGPEQVEGYPITTPGTFSVGNANVELASGFKSLEGGFRYVWLQSRYPGTNSDLAYYIALNPLGGNVGIGTNTPAGKLSVIGTATGLTLDINTNQLVVTNGMVGINIATPTKTLEVNGLGKFQGITNSGANVDIGNTTLNYALNVRGPEQNAGYPVSIPGNATIGSDNVHCAFGVQLSSARRYSWIQSRYPSIATNIAYDIALDPLGGNVIIGGVEAGTSADKVLAIANGTAPSTSPADMIQLYAEDVSSSSELKLRSEAGLITQLSGAASFPTNVSIPSLHIGGTSDAGDNNLIVDGTISAVGGIKFSSLTVTNVLTLPVTTNTDLGVIKKATAPWIHDYRAPGCDGKNIFLGEGAGNFTMGGDTYEGSYNIGIGASSLLQLTTGWDNTVVGTYAGYSLTVGKANVALGLEALYSGTSNSNCVAIGTGAGYYETGNDKLYIDAYPRASESDGRTNALIYGIFDAHAADQTLSINGVLNLTQNRITSTSDLTIACPTNKTIVLEMPVWDDLMYVPTALDFAGATDPTLVNYQPAGSGATCKLYEFAVNDVGYFTIQLPHKYKVGTDILVHVHWTPGTRGNEEGTNAVGWKVLYSWANIDGTFPAMSTADCSDACQSTDHAHLMSPQVTIDGHTVAKGISSILLCNITRTDTGTDDTWASTNSGELPMLLGVDFHYQIDTMGSRTSGAK